MRARPLVWVLTTSSQSTAVLLEAWMLFWPRAMLTAGIMRETSPARWPALCGSAAAPPGTHSNSDNRNADRRTRGEFVFIAFSSKGFRFYLLLLSEPRGTVKLNSRPRFASANRPAAKRPRGPRSGRSIRHGYLVRNPARKGSCERRLAGRKSQA